MALKHVPGTVWKHHGAWHWRVTLPGESKRRDVILTFPFSGKRIPADCPESTAEAAAWRLWEKEAAKRITDRYSFEAAEDEILREATPAALAMG